MATIVSTHLAEGQSTTRPPLFNGENYNYWKVRMMIFIQANSYEEWNIISKGPKIPSKLVENRRVPKEENEYDENDFKMVQLNAKAKHTLYCALHPSEFNRISSCDTAKQIWDKLEVTHEGTNQVKESRINMLVHDYEMFNMEIDESIPSMFTRFTNIINALKSLGKSYTNGEMVRKILRSLPKGWQPKVTAIQEAKDLNILELDELMGSLMTHEITMKSHDDHDKKKKGIAFKSSIKEDESSEEDDDEEFAMMARRFKKFFRKGGQRFNQRRDDTFKKNLKEEPQKKEPIICYECKKPGHIKAECPKLRKFSKDKKKGKKAMIAAWGESDSESSSDEESDSEVANFCLMAKEDEEILNEVSPTYDELQEALEDLYIELRKIGAKNTCLKKIVSSLTNELESLKSENESLKRDISNLTKERDELRSKNLDIEKINYNFVQGSENLKKLLGLQRCVYDKAGIGYDPNEKQKSFKNIFVKEPQVTHPHITCHYCSKVGHYISSCPYKRNMNMGVKKVWVPKGTQTTNQQGPKKIWVPKINT